MHAPLMPSAAARWSICALSVSLEAAYPETEESPASLEGTAAHWVVESYLKPGGSMPVLDSPAPNGVLVTGEMIEGAQLTRSTIEDALGPTWREILFIERKVQIPRIHPECWGTPDYYAWAGNELFLFDYKFGHGVVEVAENLQLIAYAAGIMKGEDDQTALLRMAIIQPRAPHRDGPVRWWKVRGSDLRGSVNILRNQAEKALMPNPEAFPSPDACKNCKGRHACEALQKASYLAADMAQQATAIDLDPHALGLELRTLVSAQGLLSARISGLEAQAVATIRQGRLVPFWMMESKPGRLAWNKPAAEVLMLGTMYGIDIAQPAAPITPTQAKKAGIPEALVDAYAARPPGAAKLVEDDGSSARLTFGGTLLTPPTSIT